MIRKRIVRAGLIFVAATGLSACGGDTVMKVEQPTRISKGLELKDLQKALDAGAVTRDEYELQFSDIFDQIVDYAAGSPTNVVNPAVMDKRR